MITHQTIQKTAQGIGSGIKKVELLAGSWDGAYAVALVVIDDIMPDAEIHENAVDVWHVLKGRGKFILGGTLVEPKEVRQGEFTAAAIEDGSIHEVSEGDVIDIARGVLHQIDARGGRLEMCIVKIN